MKARLGARLLALGLMVLVVANACAVASAAPRAAGTLPGRYIVVYRGSVAAPARETAERERAEGFRSSVRYSHAVKGFAARLSVRQVAALRNDPQVALVVPDRAVHATATVPLAAREQLPPTGLRRIEAASATSARQAASAAVAVIDTGVDLAHPDLNATTGTNCVAPGQPAQDDNGHGTHVAGTIAATNAGAGVVGVAPGTRIYGVKVLDAAGSGTESQVICGIDWVAANAAALNIKVANMSLGGTGVPLSACPTTSDPEHNAICSATAAGVTFVVAAGNDGWDFDFASAPDVPAAYPEVLTVAAMSDSDGQPGSRGGAPACRTSERDDRFASFRTSR